jgi:hypothetical protein
MPLLYLLQMPSLYLLELPLLYLLARVAGHVVVLNSIPENRRLDVPSGLLGRFGVVASFSTTWFPNTAA